MSNEQAMAERTAELFEGIRGVVEHNVGGRVNVGKWLDPIGGRGSGRERVHADLAYFLGAVDQMVDILPAARLSVVRNEVSVAIRDDVVFVASFGFGRLHLLERRSGTDRLLGSFSHAMGTRAFLWRLCVTEWDRFELENSDIDSLRVIRTSRGVSFNVRSRTDSEGPSAIVWDAEDAISFARGGALEIEMLLETARMFVARGSSVTLSRLVSFENRVSGCLFGGAVGDALGYPVEFSTLDAITAAVGPIGVREFLAMPGLPHGAVSDDTQMTLFTADALARRDDRAPVRASLVDAYRDWYLTQTTSAAVPNAQNESKGCGTVMRSAPFGLVVSWTPEQSFGYAAQAAAITHGHPTAHVAAGALAMLIRLLVAGEPLAQAVAQTLKHVVREEDSTGLTETSTALRKAANPVDGWSGGHESVDSLAAGWIAEEALAIAVYCALRFPERDQIEDALVFAVTHSGDSHSTGSICGNILGALHGADAIPERWRHAVEGRDTIQAVAVSVALANVG